MVAQVNHLCSYEENPVIPPENEPAHVAHERRRRLLNENQVLAAGYFVRRLEKFMKYIVTRKDVLGGTLTDWVIRYETQGRGSIHAHMLLWITVDPDYIRPDDEIHLTEAIEQHYSLSITNQATQVTSKVYDELILNYTNGNIWAFKQACNLNRKLDVVDNE